MQALGLIWSSDGHLHELTKVESDVLRVQFNNLPFVGKKEIAEEAIDLVAHFESLHDGNKTTAVLEPHMDPIGIWTVGYGIALRDEKGNFIKGKENKDKAFKHKLSFLTKERYWELLGEMMVHEYLPLVKKIVGNIDMDVFTKGALTSFCYNCGTHYKNSRGQLIPYAIWNNIKSMNADNLQRYWENSVIKAGGKILPGLVRRRKAEAFLNRFKKNKFYF